MRPVDAEALEKKISEWLGQPGNGDYYSGYDAALCAVQDLIADTPTLTPPNETPPCYQPDGDGCAYQCYDGDDEPIDKCKECPLCYSDKQRHHAPPNEWVSAKDNPPQLTGKYICCVEDTHGHMWSIPADYLLEMKTWVGEFGEIKNKVVSWMPLPSPPDRRPPEGEEDT